MRRHWKRILLGLALVLMPLWVFGDPPVYSAKEMRGQVVDGDTGQPLEGVVIVAEWKLYHEGIGSGGHGGAIKTIEALTDKEGRYFIPGWGPVIRPPFAYLDFYDPRLRMFKSNYYPQDLSNEVLSGANRDRSVMRRSRWDGKVIKLTPFKGDWYDYGFNKLGGIWSDIGDCVRECPRFVLALDAESRRIKALAPKEPFIPQIINLGNMPFSDGDREFLKRFKDEK